MQTILPKNFFHHKTYMYIITYIAAMGGLLFGFDTGVIAGALPFIINTFHPSTFEIQLIVSTLVLGAFIGALISGKLANYLGRKKLLIGVSILFILGTILCSFANNTSIIIIGRFILGAAVGVTSYVVPLFIAEISLPSKRGKMVILNGFCITGAQALAFIFDFYFAKHYPGSINWRLMIGVSIIPSLMLLFGLLFIPESPRWLMLKGRKSEAKAVLDKIRDKNDVQQELFEIQETLSVKSLKFFELFSKKIRGVMLIGLVLGIGQQFVGINTVMYYGPEIFKKIGFESVTGQILATFGMGLVNFIFTIFCLFTADKVGRRSLLLTGMSLVVVSLGMFSWIMGTHYNETTLGKILSVLMLIIYISGYAMSVGTLFWLFISEIYPLSARSLGMSFVAAIQWLGNFAVSCSFLTVVDTFGSSTTFLLYGFAALFVLLFIFYFVPETKGTSLEKIELNLQKGMKLRNIGS